MKAERIRDRGTVANRHEADSLLERAGDCVLVERGVPRSLVMRCPDGCGELLTINLDPRTDKAWRFYRRRNQVSLFPSVWRDTGCGSHFILWNHTIIWCGRYQTRRHAEIADEEPLRVRILKVVDSQWKHYWDIAEELDEVPWDVDYLCRAMTRHGGPLVEGEGRLDGHFKLASFPWKSTGRK